jgi:hypothetical protein
MNEIAPIGILQISPTTELPVVIVVVVLFLASAVLGTLIALKAFQGFLQTGSRPMLYLAFGIVFLTAVPAVLSFLLTTFTATPAHMTVLFTKGAEIIGLASIFYSLYGTFESEENRDTN